MVEKENTQELEIQGNEVRILTDNHSLEIEVASSVLREDFLAPFLGTGNGRYNRFAFFLCRMRSIV